MKIAVISDLHIGAGDVTDQFGHDDFEFMKFLKFLENNFEKIILLGDIYECLMPKKPGQFKQALTNCFDSHKEIVKRFENPQYSYIHGNHDIITNSVMKIPDELYLNVDNQKIIFTHGHQYDRLIQNAKFLSEIGIFFGGWLLRLGFMPLYKLIKLIDVHFTKMENNFPNEKLKTRFRSLAIKNAQQRNADIIVTGHTHIAAASEYDNRLYLNSGTCSEGRISFLSMDTKSGDYKTNEKF